MNLQLKGFNTENIESILYHYNVEMDMLANDGHVVMTHSLRSTYTMTPGERAKNNCVFDGDYLINDMYYSPNNRKEIEWTFARNKKFTSTLFNTSDESCADYMRDEGIKLLESQWDTVNLLFSSFPKLPATGIVHAFVYDIIGMDQILSHIVSCNYSYNDFGDMKPVCTLNNKQFDMSADLYDSGSNYNNGDTLVLYTGNANYNGHDVAIFNFECNNSSFHMSSKEHKKNGFSYYSGTLAVDIRTSLLYGCKMFEYIFYDNTKLMRRNMLIKSNKFMYK